MEEYKWFESAQDDLKTAEDNITLRHYKWACFQAQQATEKALKSLLIKNTKKFPKIHDLVELAKLVHAPQEIIISCGKLNPHYVVARYPDFSENYSKEDAHYFVKIAGEIVQWTKKNLN
ncbi:MAG: hypothetical protein RL557_525 [archaeon]|jgi:HEPN domain-containing protein